MSTLSFDVFWRDRGASQGAKNLGKDVEEAHGKVQKLSQSGGQLVGAFAGFAAIEVFKNFIEKGEEAERASRLTEDAIRRTGGAAGVTADDVDRLAQALSNKTGTDDDAVRSGANLLLTFDKVKNSVGEGNDVFNRATADALDWAAAQNNGRATAEGMAAASQALGKALQDPEHATRLLRSAGVTLTAQQQEQIKTFIKSGDTLDAQKIILGGLEAKYKGTAEAGASATDKLHAQLDNISQDIGKALLPAVESFANWMSSTGVPVIETFVGVLSRIPGPAYAVAAGLVGVVVGAKAINSVVGTTKEIAEGVGKAFEVFGLRVGEAAAAEGVEAAAATASAGATTAAGDAAAVAGTKFGALAGKLALVAGIAGLAYAASQAAEWASGAMSAKVSTDALNQSMTEWARTGKTSGAALDVFRQGWGPFAQDVHTSGQAIQTFGDLAKGAIGGANESWTDWIGRMQNGSDRMGRLNSIASQYDATLTAMVKGGSVADAKTMFDKLTGAAVSQGVSLDDAKNLFPQYNAAVAASAAPNRAAAGAIGDQTGAANAQVTTLGDLLNAYPKYRDQILKATGLSGDATSQTIALSGAQTKAAGSAIKQQAALDALTDSLTASKNATLSLMGGEDAYFSAVDSVTGALKQNGKTLDAHTEKGRANRQALEGLSSSGLGYLNVIQQNEGVGKHFKTTLDTQWTALYNAAIRFGMTKAEAKKYANEIYAVPKALSTQVSTPGLPAAKSALARLQTQINSLHGSNIEIRVDSKGNLIQHVSRGGDFAGNKDGGFITGPGGPRSDSILSRLSNGEFVVNAAATSRHRGTLEAINSGGFADGGYVRIHTGATVPTGNWLGSAQAAWQNAAARAYFASGGGGGGGPIPGGSGVTRWGPMVHRALTILGLAGDPFVFSRVMRQMNTESGGNPAAINLWDSNAKAGDPSRGLMQVIGGTFGAYHWPGTSFNIYDPWANILAALNYAKHRYGSSLYALGNGHGYARGTNSAAPGWGVVGEEGPELIRFRGGEQVIPHQRSRMMRGGGGGTVEVHVHLDGAMAGLEDRVFDVIDRGARRGRMDRIVKMATA